MLNLESILKKAGERYAQAYNLEPNLGEIRSEQVKALAAVLVEAINREFASMGVREVHRELDTDTREKTLFGGSRTGKTFSHSVVRDEGSVLHVECDLPSCPLCLSLGSSLGECAPGMTD